MGCQLQATIRLLAVTNQLENKACYISMALPCIRAVEFDK